MPLSRVTLAALTLELSVLQNNLEDLLYQAYAQGKDAGYEEGLEDGKKEVV